MADPGVESAITSGVVNASSSGGRVRVMPLGEADAILEGEVTGYSLEGVARGQGTVAPAASEIGRKVVNLALDRF